MFHYCLMALLLCGATFAQTLSLSGPATAKAGGTLTVNVSLSGSAATGPAGLQWTIAPPSGFTVSATGLGASANTANKTLVCNTSNTTCLLYGMNTTVMGSGTVATLTVAVPSTAGGTAAFSLSGLFGATQSALVMAVTSGPALSVSVFARSDINNDGVTNVSDVGLIVNQVIGATCTDDQNGDGKCDLIDVYVIVLKAMGL